MKPQINSVSELLYREATDSSEQLKVEFIVKAKHVKAKTCVTAAPRNTSKPARYFQPPLSFARREQDESDVEHEYVSDGEGSARRNLKEYDDEDCYAD